VRRQEEVGAFSQLPDVDRRILNRVMPNVSLDLGHVPPDNTSSSSHHILVLSIDSSSRTAV